MKTPMQEILNWESDLTQMFDSDQRIAMALLEHIRKNSKEMIDEEKEMIINAVDYGCSNFGCGKDAEDYYNETFNTKEK